MGGMGPAPKSDDRRARRNATIAMTRLPASGRTGAPPPWPLPLNAKLTVGLAAAEAQREKIEALLQDDPTPQLVRELGRVDERVRMLQMQLRESLHLELLMWFSLWRTPQAVMWELQSWTREVAQYARLKVLAELGDLDAQKEARQVSDRLGLTPLALLRLRWEVVQDAASDSTPRGPGPGRGSRYGGMRLVRGDTGDDAVAS